MKRIWSEQSALTTHNPTYTVYPVATALRTERASNRARDSMSASAASLPLLWWSFLFNELLLFYLTGSQPAASSAHRRDRCGSNLCHSGRGECRPLFSLRLINLHRVSPPLSHSRYKTGRNYDKKICLCAYHSRLFYVGLSPCI